MPEEDQWNPVDGYPHVQVRGDMWEMVFRCCCGAEMTFAGTNARKRGEKHIKQFHGKCGDEE